MTAFDSTKDYILENDVVLLRPMQESDIEHLLVFSLNEPDLWKFSLVSPAGENGMRDYIMAALDGRAKGMEYSFIVFDKRTQQYAGSTRFYDIQINNKSTQLGYTWYGKKDRKSVV